MWEQDLRAGAADPDHAVAPESIAAALGAIDALRAIVEQADHVASAYWMDADPDSLHELMRDLESVRARHCGVVDAAGVGSAEESRHVG